MTDRERAENLIKEYFVLSLEESGNCGEREIQAVLAAFREVKASAWEEAAAEAGEESTRGRTGDYQLACRYLAEHCRERAAALREGRDE